VIGWGLGCRPAGLHVFTPLGRGRLMIVSNRFSDCLCMQLFGSDPDAQKWLGWPAEDLVTGPARVFANQPIRTQIGVIPPMPHFLSFTAIDRRTYDVAGSITIHRHGSIPMAGGMMRKDYRGKGFGTEAMRIVRRLAHRHFGIATLTAGSERGHLASERWLRASGFTAVPGPRTHVLPNGREVESMWWQSADKHAKRRCRWLRPQRHDLFGALVRERPDDFPEQFLGWLREIEKLGDTGCPQPCGLCRSAAQLSTMEAS
jgi:RimJ/RimL family protein N-acetyltransferase